MNECSVKKELVSLIETYFDAPDKFKDQFFTSCTNKLSILCILQELGQTAKVWQDAITNSESVRTNGGDAFTMIDVEAQAACHDIRLIEVDDIPAKWDGMLTQKEKEDLLKTAWDHVNSDYPPFTHKGEFEDCVNGEFKDLVKDACLEKLTESLTSRGSLLVDDEEVREELIDYLRDDDISVNGKMIYYGKRKD